MFLRILLSTLAALLLAGAWALHVGRLVLPEAYDPRRPLDVAAEPNLLTRFKLARAMDEPSACLAALATSGMRYEPVPDRSTGEGCGFSHAVRLQAGWSLAIGSSVVLSCPAALSFAMWERHAVQPAATRRLGAHVASIDHLGSYACRNVNTGEGATRGASGGRRSRHATADAIDIAGFTPSEGSRIVVRRDWQPRAEGRNDAQALFLHDVHAGACTWFEGVLGPDYNAVHADHFHLETGGWGMCR